MNFSSYIGRQKRQKLYSLEAIIVRESRERLASGLAMQHIKYLDTQTHRPHHTDTRKTHTNIKYIYIYTIYNIQ